MKDGMLLYVNPNHSSEKGTFIVWQRNGKICKGICSLEKSAEL